MTSAVGPLILFTFAALTAFAGDGTYFSKPAPFWDGWETNTCAHPFRKVGTRYHDLRPLFAWINKPQSQRLKTPRPLPEWTRFTYLDVTQIFSDGLLCGESTHVFIRNHPNQKTAVDRDTLLPFLAFKLHDRFQYRTPLGVVMTVDQYDYGEPFDPAQLARDAKAKAK